MPVTTLPPVMLKLSGEAFSPAAATSATDEPVSHLPICPEQVDRFAVEIVKAHALTGVPIAIVVGGGNIWRGGSGPASNMDRNQADNIGMLGTAINAIALAEALRRNGANDPRVMSAVPIHQLCEDWIVGRARKHLSKGRFVLCAAGLGEARFTTDTACVQRALDIGASIVLKGTHNVDGVYSADPREDTTATRYDQVTFEEVIARGLQVMDGTAFTHARAAKLPIRVFRAMGEGNIVRAIAGEPVGTLVHA